MKEGIHPKYEAVNISCVCGAVYPTRTTAGSKLERIDICASCHPFYTGKTKVLDTEGRIEKFKKKFGGNYGETAANKTKK